MWRPEHGLSWTAMACDKPYMPSRISGDTFLIDVNNE